MDTINDIFMLGGNEGIAILIFKLGILSSLILTSPDEKRRSHEKYQYAALLIILGFLTLN